MPKLTFRDWLFGVLILLLGPLTAIGGLWVWADHYDRLPQAAPLICDVETSLAWIGDPVTHRAVFTPPPPPGGARAPPPPLDLLIMVDVSGSTGSYRPAFNDAVTRLAHQMLDDSARGNRISLANFAADANLMVDWTTDPALVVRPLPQLVNMTGENDSRAVFDLAAQVMAKARTNARHVIVFYTDGYIVSCPPNVCPHLYTWAEISAASAKLRDGGAELFAIGLPGTLNPEMIQVTGTADHMITPDNLSDLSPALTAIATNSANVLAQNGTFSESIDGRLFGIDDNPEWQVADGTVRHAVTPVIAAPDTFVNRLVPHTLGLMPTGFGPAHFRYLDAGLTGSINHEAREPLLLVISPWLLFIACLPALAWTVVYATQRPIPEPEEAATMPFHMPPPRALAARPLPRPPVAGPLVPTLYIGLGGWGRRALDATKRELHELHRQPPSHFVALDVDSFPNPDLPDDAAILLKPPPEVTDTAGYIAAAAGSGTQYAALNLNTHANESREHLNLARGTHGDRQLAELAFLRWLETADLAGELRNHLHALSAMPTAPGGLRQIVVFTRMAGGFGGTVALDLARVLRRLARDEQATTNFVPECLIVADATATDRDSGRRRDAFIAECRTSAGFRQHPRRITLLGGDPLLDRVDAEAPYDSLLALSGDDADTVVQAAILGGVLADAAPRRAMLREIDARLGSFANIGCTALTVRHDLARRLIIEEFQARLISSTLLGPLAERPEGGELAPVAIGQREAQQLLPRLAIGDSPASPWFRLVQAAEDPTTLDSFLEALERPGPGNLEWLRAAAASALTEQLDQQSADQSGIGPMGVAMVLDELASRLSGQLKSDAALRSKSAGTLAAFDTIAASLRSLSADLRSWVGGLVAAVNTAASSKARLLASADSGSGALVAIGERFTEQSVARQFTEAMTAWAAADINRVPDGRLLKFAIVTNGDRLMPLVRGRMGQQLELHSPDEVVAAIRQVAAQVVEVVPKAWLDTSLADLDAASAVGYVARLADRQDRSAGEVLVRPLAISPAVSARVDAFARSVPAPLGQFPRIDAIGADRLMMRRLWWSEAHYPAGSDALPLVQAIDVRALEARRRITAYLGRRVDELPAGLAFALASRDCFGVFARAYEGGELELRTNGAGRESWFLVNDGTFLTDGDTNLAAAAANFVQEPRLCAMQFADGNGRGDFSLLDAWLDRRSGVDPRQFDRLITLAAIRHLGLVS